MRRSVRAVAALGVGVLGLAAVVAGPVVAQDEEEAGGETRSVAPEECQVEPRPVDEVAALIAGEDDTEERQPPVPVPFGEVAGGGTVDDVTAAARGLLACVNAGDPARAAAWLTDSGVRRFLSFVLGEATAADAVGDRLAATPTPLAEDARLRLVAVTDVARLEGGRAVALVVFNDPRRPPRGAETLLVTFAREGEGEEAGLLVDDYVVFTVPTERAAGTPAAGTPPVE